MNEIISKYKQTIITIATVFVLAGLSILVYQSFSLSDRLVKVEQVTVQNTNNIQQIINYLNQQIQAAQETQKK